MDVFPDDKIEYLSSPSRFIKKCLNCESVYITEKECEACGFQFREPDLGEPVDEKSFYSIREEYQTKGNKIAKFFLGGRSLRYKEFRSRLLHRFRNLLAKMEFPSDDVGKWNYFRFELLDLSKFLSKDSSNDIFLDRILFLIREHPFYHEIKKIVISEKEDRNKKNPMDKRTKFYLCFFLIPIFFALLAPFLYKSIQ